jgi:hypothetical protein
MSCTYHTLASFPFELSRVFLHVIHYEYDTGNVVLGIMNGAEIRRLENADITFICGGNTSY